VNEIRTIAFIGLGAMGLPMAKRLAAAGFAVRSAVHKDKAAGDALAAAGGAIRPSFAEAVKDADLILSILPNDAAMESVYLDPAFIGAAPEGVRILDMTSCTAAMMKRIAARWSETKKAVVVAAPGRGRVGGAPSGGGPIFAAGADEAVASLAPVFAVLGKNVFRLANIGDGKAIKAVNQMLAAVNAVAVAEAHQLAGKLGLDMEKTYEIIRVSSGGSYVFDHKFMKIASGDFSSGFKFSLMKKDLGIALDEAKGLSVPLAELASTVYAKCAGHDDEDYSVLSSVYAEKKI